MGRAQSVSLRMENPELADVISEIEKQANVKFAYDDQVVLKGRLNGTLQFNQSDLSQVLLDLNSRTNFKFTRIGNNISVVPVKVKAETVQQQKVTLSGVIRDDFGQPLPGASIYISGVNNGTATDNNGGFSIQLPKGTYTVKVSFMGFKTYETSVALTKNTTLEYTMKIDGEELGEVVITQSKNAADVKAPQMSVNSLSVQDIKKIPVALGEPDPIKSLFKLPGVTNAGEGASGFNVRGGAADQNLILLDGTPIYSDSHMFGFFSVFNADAVSGLDLYKGGIPAQFGGRVASILDVRQQSGDNQEYHVDGSVGVISSKLKVRGPLVKDKGSFMVAGRTSYAHLFLKLADNNNSAKFYDLNTRLNYALSEHNQISVSGYAGKDVFDIANSFLSRYGNNMANLNWKHTFSDNLYAETMVYYSDYRFGLELNTQNFVWDSYVKSYGGKYTMRQTVSDHFKLNYGIEGLYYHFNPGTMKPKGDDSQINYTQLDKKFALEPSLFIEAEQTLFEKLTLRYGIRYSMFYRYGAQQIAEYEQNAPLVYNADYNIYEAGTIVGYKNYGKGEVMADYNNWEPRAAISYLLNENTSIKLSYNKMAQYLHILSNSQSPTPVNIWTPSGPFIKPQLLSQYAAGYFRNFNNKAYSLETEVFYKDVKNRIDYVDGANLIGENNLEQSILNGRARSYGWEFLFRKNTGAWTGWVSYTLSRAEQQTKGLSENDPGVANGEWYRSNYDKLHNLSVNAAYDLSDKWSFSGSFTLQSGKPVTYANGYYEFGGIPVPDYGARNSSRLPAYHHLDIAATYVPKPDKHKGWQGSWVFSIYNLYNRQNAASMRFVTNDDTGMNETRRLSIFGILPSVSYMFSF